MKTVNIIVPIYKSSPSETDRISLDRLVEILGGKGIEPGFKITAICPEGLDLSTFKELYPSFSF